MELDPALPLLSEEQWLDLAESYIGRCSPRRWSAHFGISIAVVQALWNLGGLPSWKPVWLLWTLYFMKVYCSYDVACSLWQVCEKSFRVHVWAVIFGLESRVKTIHLDARLHDPGFGFTHLILDSKICPVAVSRSDWIEQRLWWDPHHRQHGIKYEVAVHVATGEIHWVLGGVYASFADITLTRNGGLLGHLLEGEHMWADKAYSGEPQILVPYRGRHSELPVASLIWNNFLARRRVLVENTFARVSRFACLQLSWRQALDKHVVVFNLICNITNLDLRLFPLRQQPEQDGFRLDRPEDWEYEI